MIEWFATSSTLSRIQNKKKKKKIAMAVFLIMISFLLHAIPSSYPAVTSPASFDVSATLQRAKEVLSSSPFTEEEVAAAAASVLDSSSSPISLLLVPHEAVYKTRFRDYKSLLAARVGGDDARLNYFRAKINGVDTNVTFQSPFTNYTGYFARLELGTPRQPFWLHLDTGSDINWVACKPCNGCAPGHPILDPFESSSYSNLPCNSSECVGLDESGCRSDVCFYQISYIDQAHSFGEYATELLSIGDNFTARIAIGCGHENPESDPKEEWLDGMIGLGPGEASLRNQLKATSFSYCLVERNSRNFSSLEFNATIPPDSVTTDLEIEGFSYYIGANQLSVNGMILPISLSDYDNVAGGGVTVDSGTELTYMPRETYDLLRVTIIESLPDLVPLAKEDGLGSFDLCYRMDPSQEVSIAFPSVAFHFTNGQNWTVPPRNIATTLDLDRICIIFVPQDERYTVIGNHQMQGTRITYDVTNNVIGFSNDKC